MYVCMFVNLCFIEPDIGEPLRKACIEAKNCHVFGYYEQGGINC
jgi:hypothetical protein